MLWGFFNKGIYDLSAFHVEQPLQLYLKYILAKELVFPKNTQTFQALL